MDVWLQSGRPSKAFIFKAKAGEGLSPTWFRVEGEDGELWTVVVEAERGESGIGPGLEGDAGCSVGCCILDP